MAKIDEKTTVPVTWLIPLLGFIIMGCSWVFSVNARLGRIEEKLGIVMPKNEFINSASANEKPNHK